MREIKLCVRKRACLYAYGTNINSEEGETRAPERCDERPVLTVCEVVCYSVLTYIVKELGCSPNGDDLITMKYFLVRVKVEPSLCLSTTTLYTHYIHTHTHIYTDTHTYIHIHTHTDTHT
jgi:hypothetical protein